MQCTLYKPISFVPLRRCLAYSILCHVVDPKLDNASVVLLVTYLTLVGVTETRQNDDPSRSKRGEEERPTSSTSELLGRATE